MSLVCYFGRRKQELRMPKGPDSLGIRYEGEVLEGRKSVEEALDDSFRNVDAHRRKVRELRPGGLEYGRHLFLLICLIVVPRAFGQNPVCADTSHTVNAMTCTISGFSPSAGATVVVAPAQANTGPATLSINGTAASNIIADGKLLTGGEFQTSVGPTAYTLAFDGTSWNLAGRRSAACLDNSPTANSIICAVSGFTFARGATLYVTPANANTGATTINVNGASKRWYAGNPATALPPGAAQSGITYEVRYDGVEFVTVSFTPALVETTASLMSSKSVALATRLPAGWPSPGLAAPSLVGMVVVDGTKYPFTDAGIQSAINDAPVGATVLLPEAIYNLGPSLPIKIRKLIHLTGTGWGTVLLVSPSVSSFTDVVSIAPSMAGCGVAACISGTTVSNLRITAKSGTPGRYGLYFNGSAGLIQDIVVDHIEIDQLGGCAIGGDGSGFNQGTPVLSTFRESILTGGVCFSNAGDTVRIMNNRINGNGYGVDVTNTAGATMLIVSGNNITSLKGVHVGGYGTAARIVSNEIEASGSFIGSNKAIIDIDCMSGQCAGPVIAYNSIQFAGTAGVNGVRINNASQALISGNRFGIPAPGNVDISVTRSALETIVGTNASGNVTPSRYISDLSGQTAVFAVLTTTSSGSQNAYVNIPITQSLTAASGITNVFSNTLNDMGFIIDSPSTAQAHLDLSAAGNVKWRLTKTYDGTNDLILFRATGAGGGSIYTQAARCSNSTGACAFAAPVAIDNGTSVVYRCTAEGVLRIGQLTTVPSDCGTAVDAGLRIK